MSGRLKRKRVVVYPADKVDVVPRDRHVRTYHDRMEGPARLIQRVWRAERTTRFPKYNTFMHYRDRKMAQPRAWLEHLEESPLALPAPAGPFATPWRASLDPRPEAQLLVDQIEAVLDDHVVFSETEFHKNRAYHRKLVNPLWLEAKAEADAFLANYV